jgi:arsenate reductase
VLTVFYNPACSKCRRVREILEERGERFEIIDYLKTPPGRERLRKVLSQLDAGPGSLVRRDARFFERGLSEEDLNDAGAVVDLIAAHPELLERPVVVRGDRALVARPPERVLDLLG